MTFIINNQNKAALIVEDENLDLDPSGLKIVIRSWYRGD